jgi:hypothetical protein
LPQLTNRQILVWAREHRRQTSRWPHQHSGPIPSATGLQWYTVDAHLRRGTRGLPGGDSLSRLLARRLKARNLSGRPQLTEDGILGWADADRRRTGRWPSCRDGAGARAPGETWKGIHQTLAEGWRGLPNGSSLARFLAERRGMARSQGAPPTGPRTRPVKRKRPAGVTPCRALTFSASARHCSVPARIVPYRSVSAPHVWQVATMTYWLAR